MFPELPYFNSYIFDYQYILLAADTLHSFVIFSTIFQAIQHIFLWLFGP
jgi:hypothetical protein